MQRDCSEQTARAIDEEVRTILHGADAHSKQIMQEHRGQLDVVAGELLQRERVDAQTFKDVLKNRSRPIGLKFGGGWPSA